MPICQGRRVSPSGAKVLCKAESEFSLCWPCTTDLQKLLVELDDLVDELQTQVTRQNRGTQNPGKATETPLPFNEQASSVAQELLHVVASLVENPSGVAEQGTDNVTKSHALIGWLRQHVVDLAHKDDAGLTVQKLTRVHGRALGVIGRPQNRMPLGDCSTCGRPVQAKASQSVVLCACGTPYNATAFRDQVQRQGRDQWVTPQQAAALGEIYGKSIKVATIWKWQSRGKIQKNDRGLYNFGEICDLAQDTEEAA